MFLLLRKRPVTGLCAARLLERRVGSKVGDLVNDILVLSLKNYLAEIELTMNKPLVMCEVHALSQLDGHVVDHLDVGARHVDRQIQVQTFGVAENVASIVVLCHGEMGTAQLFSETVERRHNVRMRLNVDPFGDVFLIGNLAHDELLSKVLVVDNIGRVANHVLHL